MQNQRVIYLDCSATTPLAPEVLEAMRPHLTDSYGNASGAYSLGRRARAAVEEARQLVAAVLGCRTGEVVFTSGGSESDNLAIRGTVDAAVAAGRPVHVVTTPVEHKAVLAPAHEVAVRHGGTCTEVEVDGQGWVDPESVFEALSPDTTLVSVMLANNEVGTLQPVAEIGALLRERGVPFHTDAVQAGAWHDLNVDTLNVDLLSLSAHKFYGPKGVGMLYVRSGTEVVTQQTGGGQEHGQRAGTENVAGIVGLAAALELTQRERTTTIERVRALRDRLIAGLTALPGVCLTGHPTQRLPHHASFCIDGIRADVLLLGLDMRGICASSGSACSSGKLSASHVLTAMGVPDDEAIGAVRFSLGRGTTDADIDHVLAVAPGLIERLRRVSAG